MEDLLEGAEIISAYTRKQAISDGVLVDMSVEPFGKLAKEAGLKWPIAMTATAFGEFVAVTDAPGHCGQDLSGRWWDVVFMFRRTRREISPLEARWTLKVRDPDGRIRLEELKCVSGPDDEGEPCLTFMLPGVVRLTLTVSQDWRTCGWRVKPSTTDRAASRSETSVLPIIRQCHRTTGPAHSESMRWDVTPCRDDDHWLRPRLDWTHGDCSRLPSQPLSLRVCKSRSGAYDGSVQKTTYSINVK